MIVHGQGENVHIGKLLPQHLRGLQAIHDGHGNIQEYDVRMEPPGLLDGLPPVVCLPHHFDVGLGL